MSKQLKHVSKAGVAWKGAFEDPRFWLDIGAQSISQGGPVEMLGVDIEPIWHWYAHDRPIPMDMTHRLFCWCGKGPVGLVWHVWQDGGPAMVRLTYLQQRSSGSMRELAAFVHPEAPGCRHGRLAAHGDQPLTLECPTHQTTVTGAFLLDLVFPHGRRALRDDPPKPRRVVLPRT